MLWIFPDRELPADISIDSVFREAPAFWAPHRKFSSHHLFHPSCLFSLLAKVRGAGDRLGDGSSVDCKWTQSIYKHKVHHTYHQNVRSLPLTFDLQRLSTLEGCTHREFEFHRLSADRRDDRHLGRTRKTLHSRAVRFPICCRIFPFPIPSLVLG